MYAVRPEFGPTLPELLSGHSRAWRYALIGGYVVILVVVLYLLLLRGDPGSTRAVVSGGGVSFELDYGEGLSRTAPVGEESLRLRGTRGRLVTTRPLRLPAFDGRPDSFLPLYAEELVAAMKRRFDGFEVRGEGRPAVNRIPGYEITFQFTRDGMTSYGRRLLLLDSYARDARAGVDMLLLEDRSGVVPNADAIGTAGSLKTLLRSFRFGD